MKKLLYLIICLFPILVRAQNPFNPTPGRIPPAVSGGAVSLTVDSSGNKILTAQAANALSKFQAKLQGDAARALATSLNIAEQNARMNQIASSNALIASQQQLINQQALTIAALRKLVTDTLNIAPDAIWKNARFRQISDSITNLAIMASQAGNYVTPTSIAISNITQTGATLTLSAVQNASYQIWRSLSATTGFTVIPNAPATGSLVYNDIGLSPGTQYYYRATATVGNNTSAYASNNLTTLPDYSQPTPGYSVMGFIDFANLGTTHGPNQYNGYYDNQIYFETTTNNNYLSVSNGVATASSSTNTIKISAPFSNVKTFKITLYNSTLDNNIFLRASNGSRSYYGIQSGNNVIYTNTSSLDSGDADSNGNYGVAYLYFGGAAISFSAVKVEVQN